MSLFFENVRYTSALKNHVCMNVCNLKNLVSRLYYNIVQKKKQKISSVRHSASKMELVQIFPRGKVRRYALMIKNLFNKLFFKRAILASHCRQPVHVVDIYPVRTGKGNSSLVL
jgi:hypothetical protein